MLGPHGQTDPKATDITLGMLSAKRAVIVPALLENDSDIWLVDLITFLNINIFYPSWHSYSAITLHNLYLRNAGVNMKKDTFSQ